ncbi:MAG: adenylate/guanylate cyclase domain-containing protein [Chloroflexota bacterium]
MTHTDEQPVNDLAPESEVWRRLLLGTDPSVMKLRRRHRRIPSPPRCKMCAAPFGPPGGWVLRYFGHARWAKNPKYCEGCFRTLQANHGGAEVECSLLFADVRGSTSLAEAMRPAQFRALMGRFYDEAFATLIDFNAIVDKFVGDEVIGIFIPAYTGRQHARHAVDAARRLLEVTGHGQTDAPWIPIGIGVNSGVAFVGSVGQGPDTELTAMGDAVNVTARLAAAAHEGEVLVTAEAAAGAGDLVGEHRALQLRGKSGLTDVVSLTVGEPVPMGE